MPASAFSILYDGDDHRDELDDICQHVVANNPNIKRGDFVYIDNPERDNRPCYMYDGEKLLEVHSGRDIPSEFKVVTEFPIQHWHSDADVFESELPIVNFNYQLFKAEIEANITQASSVYSIFHHNGEEYRLIFDGLHELPDDRKAEILNILNEEECYYSPCPREEVEEIPSNYLYVVPYDTW